MRIGSLRIQGLRCLEDLRVELHPNITVLMGSNNCGKTTVLDALAAILCHRRGTVPFTESDIRAGGGSAICITIILLPTDGEKRFRSGEPGELTAEVSREGDERLRLCLRVHQDQDVSVQDLRAELHQVDADGVPVSQELSSFPFRDAMPFRAFGMERDIRRGTAARWSDWGRVLSTTGPNSALLGEVMKIIRDAGQRLVGETQALQRVQEELGSILGTLGLPVASRIDLVAALSEPSALVRQLSMEILPDRSDRAFSAERHGMGTQGALLFAIYELFVRQVLRANETERQVSPVLTVEEIETHLHPTAQRAIARRLAALPGQAVVTTHSPEVIRALSKTKQVVLLRATKAGTECRTVARDQRFVFDHARSLFARCVILAEGFEDQAVLAVSTARNIDLSAHNIEIVNCGGQGTVNMHWETLAGGYGIPVVCVGDFDNRQFLKSFLETVSQTSGVVIRDIVRMSDGDIFTALRMHSYFTPDPGGSLESEVVRVGRATVDRRILGTSRMSTFEEWRTRRSTADATATDDELRAGWLAQKSHKRLIPGLLDEILAEPSASAPPYLAAAIDRAIELAREY